MDIAGLKARAISRKRDFEQLVKRMRLMKPQDLDKKVNALHHEAFEQLDCLECANCCKGLGPRLTQPDIERLSAYLKMKTAVFTDTYLRIDEDQDYVFKSMPCPFIMPDNYCMVYSSRPRACRAYPHTDQKNIRSILSTCLHNTETCPAVFSIFEQLYQEIVRK